MTTSLPSWFPLPKILSLLLATHCQDRTKARQIKSQEDSRRQQKKKKKKGNLSLKVLAKHPRPEGRQTDRPLLQAQCRQVFHTLETLLHARFPNGRLKLGEGVVREDLRQVLRDLVVAHELELNCGHQRGVLNEAHKVCLQEAPKNLLIKQVNKLRVLDLGVRVQKGLDEGEFGLQRLTEVAVWELFNLNLTDGVENKFILFENAI